MAKRTTQRPPNYAFSQQLHLTNSLAQRVLALAVREGLSPMQAVLKCLDDHLPRVRVEVVGEPAQPIGDTPSQTWELAQGARVIDLPTPSDVRDFAPADANWHSVTNAVNLLRRVALYQPVGKGFGLVDLFQPGVWLSFPERFRTAVRVRFQRQMVRNQVKGSDAPQFRVLRTQPHTLYTRLR